MYMFVCLCLFVFASRCVANQLQYVPELRGIDDQAWRPSDRTLWVLRDRRPWASVWWRQVSSDLLCPIYFIIHQPAYHDQPKDWLALYLSCPWLPFRLLWLASCYCFTLINGTWCEHLWYDVVSMIMMLDWWYFRGLERFLECLSVRTCSLDDRPGKQCNHEGEMGCP